MGPSDLVGKGECGVHSKIDREDRDLGQEDEAEIAFLSLAQALPFQRSAKALVINWLLPGIGHKWPPSLTR